MSVYLDASVLVPLQIREAATGIARNFVAALEDAPIVSALAAGEFASAMSRLVRMDMISPDDARKRLALFDDWMASDTARLPIDNSDITRASELVRRFEHKLLMPDAIHAALCERHQLTLGTLDERLAAAADALGIDQILLADPRG